MCLIKYILEQNYKKANKVLRDLKKEYFDIIGKLEQRTAARVVIMAQAKYIEHQKENSYIPEKEGNEIQQFLSHKLEKLLSFITIFRLTSKADLEFYAKFKPYLEVS